MVKSHPNGSKQKNAASGKDGAVCETRGSLVIIGGNENKHGHRPILQELAKRTGKGKLIVATIASEEPQPQWEEYKRVFSELGVHRIDHLDVRQRDELVNNERLDVLTDAKVVFFAGGDQMKITSRFGGTRLCETLRDAYRKGATVAGTSSGASAMSDIMMTAGDSDASHDTRGSLRMAPGLGLLPGVIIDQHFAERGRIGRLLGAVAQNPRLLGIGIDEDTAILVEGNREALVMGSGAVYLLDAREMTYTNSTQDDSQIMSAFGIRLDVLSGGDRFNLDERRPVSGAPAPQER